MINIKSPFSTKILIFLFALLSAVFIIFSLPASLIGKELNKNGVYFSNQSGTFWNAHFDQVSILNLQWQKLEVRPSMFSIFGQGLEFDFNLKNSDRYAEGETTIQDNFLILNNITIRSDISYKQNGSVINSIVGLDAQELVLSKNGQCQEGEFNIEMDLLNQFSKILNIDFPVMQGLGICQNGIVSINMGASKDDIEVKYLGEFVENKQSGLLSINLPAVLEQNSQVTNMLRQYGFEKSRDQWQANMEIGL